MQRQLDSLIYQSNYELHGAWKKTILRIGNFCSHLNTASFSMNLVFVCVMCRKGRKTRWRRVERLLRCLPTWTYDCDLRPTTHDPWPMTYDLPTNPGPNPRPTTATHDQWSTTYDLWPTTYDLLTLDLRCAIYDLRPTTHDLWPMTYDLPTNPGPNPGPTTASAGGAVWGRVQAVDVGTHAWTCGRAVWRQRRPQALGRLGYRQQGGRRNR